VAAGEYCVDGDVVIPQGTTLDIPAGTSFIFTGRYHFGRDPSFPDDEAHPSGSIRAIGTASAPIVFRGASESTAWYGIVIYHSDQKVQLEYVTIRDTYKDDPNVNSRIWTRGGALSSYVNNPGTIIRHSTFINNRSISISGAIDINSHGMWPNEGPIEITNSVFENNIAECTVFGGGATDPCGGGAVFFAHVGGDASVIKIENNVFRGNTAKKTAQDDACGGALAGFVDVSIVLGPGNVFENNSASTSGGAICCSGDTKLGAVFTAIDSSVRFTGNTPNNGCGR
jgi:predicted outer membrane repeat protein